MTRDKESEKSKEEDAKQDPKPETETPEVSVTEEAVTSNTTETTPINNGGSGEEGPLSIPTEPTAEPVATQGIPTEPNNGQPPPHGGGETEETTEDSDTNGQPIMKGDVVFPCLVIYGLERLIIH